MDRRAFLKKSLLSPFFISMPSLALSKDKKDTKTLNLINCKTGEKLSDLPICENGHYGVDARDAVNHFFRDFRSGEVKDIDPQLLHHLHSLSDLLETSKPLSLLSGYRSPTTNQKLRKMGRKVAKKSYHMKGMAADIYVEGVPLIYVKKAALKINQNGGVGSYSSFVHLDTGPKRRWGAI